jgi:Fur family ferric uptake transcriptional regulator
MKKTKARQAIIETLTVASEPLSAASVFQRLNISVDQVTVYRNLHLLEEEGLADSFILHCADHGTERYYTASPQTGGNGYTVHRHWFHCEKCHNFIDLGSCKLAELVADYETQYGLSVHTHTLYLTGVCANCKSPEPREKANAQE